MASLEGNNLVAVYFFILSEIWQEGVAYGGSGMIRGGLLYQGQLLCKLIFIVWSL